MPVISKLEIMYYVSIVHRRKWWIVVPFIIALVGGLVFLKLCPKTYLTSTLILLEPQTIPDSFVRSTVTESMEGRLRTITQQIQSRTNLENVIQEFHLSHKDETTFGRMLASMRSRIPFIKNSSASNHETDTDRKLILNSLVDRLRQRLQVNMKGGGAGREQNLTFEVSFQWHDPDVMANVTNTIARRFIDENLSIREEKAIGTTDFLEKETATIRSELETREKVLEAFKRENMGMLPDQLTSNLNILNQLRDEMLSLERRMDEERQQAILLRAQAQAPRADRQPAISPVRQVPRRDSTARRDSPLTNDELLTGDLEDLESELSRLRSSYTDSHPDIVALQRRIEVLKQQAGATRPHTVSAHHEPAPNNIVPQLAQINARIEDYQKQMSEVQKQIQVYKDRVERTPQVEMAMNNILRDYQTVRQRYDNMLARKLDAKMAEQMEKRKKGEQFRILDPAVKPIIPFSPQPFKIMLFAIAAGLGLGCGLAYLRESLDPCFYSPEDLESFLGVPVMVSLPFADNPDKA